MNLLFHIRQKEKSRKKQIASVNKIQKNLIKLKRLFSASLRFASAM